MSGAMRRIGEYLGLLEDTGRYEDELDEDQYEAMAVGQSAPLGEDPGPAYDRLVRIHRELLAGHPDATWLSAGMSGDLETGVRAGATHVRLGTAVLGPRPRN